MASSGGSIYLSGGHVVDPSQGVDGPSDVLIADGVIVAVGSADALADEMRTLPRSGNAVRQVQLTRSTIVAPGFVDLCAHIEHIDESQGETLATLAHAAVAGGFTTICCTPDSGPALDTPAALAYVRAQAMQAVGARARVRPIAALTKGAQGRDLAELVALAAAGAVAFSDNGHPIGSSRLMRSALEYATPIGLPVIAQCADEGLAGGGVMHEGPIATLLGLPGWPAAAEEVVLARDLALVRLTGTRYHAAHLSTARAVALVRAAKAEGLPVTADVTPHHLLLMDAWVAGERTGPLADALVALGLPPAPGVRYDTNTKVNPPLRGAEDCAALLAGLLDGTITAIATDHTPRSAVEKDGEYGEAACGIAGLETVLASLLTLVPSGSLPLTTLIAALSERPARAFGLEAGTLRPGAVADITVFDPNEEWMVDVERLASRGHNTPLAGITLRGRVRMTLLGGEVVYEAASLK